jgi:hypothetical protein
MYLRTLTHTHTAATPTIACDVVVCVCVAKIEGQVLKIVEETVTPAFLKRHAYLSHLPPMAAIKHVELDLATAMISPSVVAGAQVAAAADNNYAVEANGSLGNKRVLNAKTLHAFRTEIRRRHQSRTALLAQDSSTTNTSSGRKQRGNLGGIALSCAPATCNVPSLIS